MRRPCSILVLFVLLGFGVSLAVPAEDVPETAYDESEALPYEGTPLYSIVLPQASARIAKAKAELSCGSLLRFNCWTKRCKGRRENNGRSPCVPNSLTILNHSLRC
jgi:hypothetical protein